MDCPAGYRSQYGTVPILFSEKPNRYKVVYIIHLFWDHSQMCHTMHENIGVQFDKYMYVEMT